MSAREHFQRSSLEIFAPKRMPTGLDDIPSLKDGLPREDQIRFVSYLEGEQRSLLYFGKMFNDWLIYRRLTYA